MSDPRTYALYLATRNLNAPLALRLAEQELKERSDVFTYDALAWALHRSGNKAQALAAIKKALAHGTQDARLFFHAAVIHEAADDLDAARQFADKSAQTITPTPGRKAGRIHGKFDQLRSHRSLPEVNFHFARFPTLEWGTRPIERKGS
jgi:tetratricopeptide (TPR) repeat protein